MAFVSYTLGMEDDSLPCTDKLAFETKEAAKGAAVYAQHRHGTRLVVYKCGDCRLWHLSSS